MVHREGSGAIKGSVWIAEAGLCDMKTGFAERTYRGWKRTNGTIGNGGKEMTAGCDSCRWLETGKHPCQVYEAHTGEQS
jgi:hypothetical protein